MDQGPAIVSGDQRGDNAFRWPGHVMQVEVKKIREVPEVHDENEHEDAGKNEQRRGQDLAYGLSGRIGYHGCRCYVRILRRTTEKAD